MNPPASIVQIVEVIGTAVQGKSNPLLCVGADGHRYYVKGQQTNRSSLWREWICGHLAKELGLPLPPFALVQLDPALVKELPKDQQAIGSLPAFGSREQPHTAWLDLGISQRVPTELQIIGVRFQLKTKIIRQFLQLTWLCHRRRPTGYEPTARCLYPASAATYTTPMRPSQALSLHRAQIRAIAMSHRVAGVSVFGSAIHGDDVEGSDLDVLVDPTPATTLLDIGAIRYELKALLGMEVDVLTPNGLPDSFRERVLREAVRL